MGAGDVTLLGPEIVTAVRGRAEAGSGRDRPGAPADRAPADDEAVTPAADDEAVTSAADDDDFEGPRRRARRERAERRAAQQRARAIEEARREAKRRLRGSATPTAARPVPRGAVRGLKMLLWGVLAVAVTVGLGLVLYFTPVMSVRTLDVVGLAAVTDAEVLDAAQVAPGTPLLQVDTDAVADRVATIRRVASARVQRQYPSTLRITIVERVPVAVRDFPDGPHLYDRDGVDFATGPPPPSLPYLDVATPDPPTRRPPPRSTCSPRCAPRWSPRSARSRRRRSPRSR